LAESSVKLKVKLTGKAAKPLALSILKQAGNKGAVQRKAFEQGGSQR
jgi:hypothetical protein